MTQLNKQSAAIFLLMPLVQGIFDFCAWSIQLSAKEALILHNPLWITIISAYALLVDKRLLLASFGYFLAMMSIYFVPSSIELVTTLSIVWLATVLWWVWKKPMPTIHRSRIKKVELKVIKNTLTKSSDKS